MVWKWSALENLPHAISDAGSRSPIYVGGDPYHCNAIQYLAGDDLVIVSMRHANSVVAIDQKSSDVVWTVGAYEGQEALKIDDPENLLGDRQVLSGNHDIHSLGGGRFSIFDNGSAEVGSARLIVFRVEQGTAVVENVVTDPAGTMSICTGSARALTEDESYWAVSWGCSTSGVSIVSADGRTVANLTIDLEQARAQGLIHSQWADVDNLAGDVTY